MWYGYRCLKKTTPFELALAMRSSSGNCNPAPELVL